MNLIKPEKINKYKLKRHNTRIMPKIIALRALSMYIGDFENLRNSDDNKKFLITYLVKATKIT